MSQKTTPKTENSMDCSQLGRKFTKESLKTLFCPCCGQETVLIEVHGHGHGQCARCGINIEPCCQGAPLENSE